MYNLAGELEEVCKTRLALAKSQAPGPASTKIKLNMSSAKPAPSNTTIKLKLGGGGRPSASPAPERTNIEARGTPGITVDGDALKRQKDSVSAAVNGGRPTPTAARNPFGGAMSRSQSAATPLPTLTRGTSHTSPPTYTNGVKAEGQSPAPNQIRPNSQAPGLATMLPPNGVNGVHSRPVSGSPHPQALVGYNGITPVAVVQQYQPPAANSFVQSKLRPAGMGEFLPFFAYFGSVFCMESGEWKELT